jgi:hypothetical protein
MSASITKRAEKPIKVPELVKVTKEEWRRVYFAAIELAEAILGEKDAAYEAVHNAFLAMCTVHRWDETKYTLKQHFLFLVGQACHTNIERKKPEAVAHEEEAAFEYYDHHTYAAENASPEELMIAREHHERHQAWRAEKRAQIRKLQRALAAYPVALQLMAYWGEHGADRPLPKIAVLIGQPIEAVYEAKKLIERFAQRIIKEGGDQ